MVKVTWTFQSVNDIENIADFIAKDSERYAQIQVHRFFEVTEILETNPEIGRDCSGIKQSYYSRNNPRKLSHYLSYCHN